MPAAQALELLAFAGFVLTVAWYWRDRRRNGRVHSTFPLWAAFTLMALFEAPFDWCAYVIFNPDFRFVLPDVVPFSLAPRPVPLVNFLVYGVVFLFPVVAGTAIARRFAPGRVVPVAMASALLVGMAWTATLENLALHWNLYVYVQTPDFAVLRAGELTQYPLVMPFTMGLYFATVTGLWCRRDDTGRWLPERRLSVRRARNPWWRVASTSALVCALYVGAMAPFALARVTGAVQNQSTPQPFAELAPYDPDDLSAAN